MLYKALFQGCSFFLSFETKILVARLDSVSVGRPVCHEPGFTFCCRSDVLQGVPSGFWMKNLTVPSASCSRACVDVYFVFKSMFQLPRWDPPRPHLLPFVLFRCVLTYFILIRSLFSPFFIFLSIFIKATVECYNPRTNEWTYVAKMNEPHYGHAGTVYGGYMYISGKTLPRDQCDSGVQCVEMLKWLIMDQMSK